MLNFCTLFDSNFLPYGLALYESLLEHCKEFHLYIFAFDEQSYLFLKAKKLEKATIISLTKFEDKELLRVKPERTRGEYCWTCASSTILYVLNNYNVELCTYLDSDIFFFSDPSILTDEIKERSVLITAHRYAKKYDFSNTSGKYCVQFVTFRNNPDGRKVLGWWRNECVKWCYNRLEDGKFGDQKYLDDWPERFKDIVHELEHIGGGVAPWNVQQYRMFKREGKLLLKEKKTKREYPLVFFHFHNVKFNDSCSIVLKNMASPYRISFLTYFLLYKTYFKRMSLIIKDMNIKKANSYEINYLYIYIRLWMFRLMTLPIRIIDKTKKTLGKIYGQTL